MTGLSTPDEHDNIVLVHAEIRGQDWLALVIKQELAIAEDGSCEPVEPSEPIFDDSELYEELEPPAVSPPRTDNDHFAFKDRTDLVVQGTAHTYGRPVTEAMVEIGFRDFMRRIRVTGDRRLLVGPDGTLRFSEPEPYESIPLRHDRAYGGFDREALRREGDWLATTFQDIRPEWKLGASTPFHYPRNPSGTGFLIRADRESVEGVAVPNLDFPFDPVTPDRMAVGDALRWPTAPMPASFDWFHQAWFPRIAHLGAVPRHDPTVQTFREVEWGWVSPSVLTQRSILMLDLNSDFVQGASAGLMAPGFRSDETVRFRNLFPDRPERQVRLPGLVPRVTLHPKWREPHPAQSHLNAVVFRPDESTAVLTWSARVQVHRRFAGPELGSVPFGLGWEMSNGTPS